MCGLAATSRSNEATVRPLFALYKTYNEIDIFIDAVGRIAEGGTNVG